MATTLVIVFALMLCLLEIVWGILQLLFYQQLLKNDYITDAFSRLLQVDFLHQSSYFILLISGVTLFINIIFSHLSSRSNDLSIGNPSQRLRRMYCSYLWLNILIFLVFIGFALKSKTSLIFSEKAAMFEVKHMQNSLDKTGLEYMNYYQEIFHCCGSVGIKDWLDIENVTIPNSCCKRLTKECKKILNNIEENCKPLNKTSNLHCDIETDEINSYGCVKAVEFFLYVNSSIIGINLCVLLFLFIAWIWKYRKLKSKIGLANSRTALARKYIEDFDDSPIVSTWQTRPRLIKVKRSFEKPSRNQNQTKLNQGVNIFPTLSRIPVHTTTDWNLSSVKKHEKATSTTFI